MLTDLLTSSRGPGVIGTVLALIVLLGFGGLMILVSDNSKGSNLGAQVKEKERRVTTLHAEIEHWKDQAVVYKENRSLAGQLESTVVKTERRKKDVEQGKVDIEAIHAKTAKLVERFEEYKRQYRIAERARAIGEEMAVLKTKEGKVYERVKIKEISALEMRFSHKNGNTGVGYKSLPDELQDRFQFTEVDALAAGAVEKKKIARSVQGGEQFRVSSKILDLKNKIRQNDQYITKWSADIRKSESDIRTYTSGMNTALERVQYYRTRHAAGHRGMTMDNVKKNERKVDSYQSKIRRAQATIASLNDKMSRARSANRQYESEMSKHQRELDQLNKKK